MKLELGKTYLDRSGKTVRIIQQVADAPLPFTGLSIDGTRTYSVTGNYRLAGMHDSDLVSEITPKPAPSCDDVMLSALETLHTELPPATAAPNINPVRLQLICAALTGLCVSSDSFNARTEPNQFAQYATDLADAVLDQFKRKS